MKRVDKLFVAAVIMLFSLFATVTIYAAPDFQNATPVSLNTAFKGNVTSGYHNQQRIYKISPNQPGGISIQFDHPRQNDSNAYWSVELYDDTYKSVMSRKIYGNYTTATLPTIGLYNKVYYITVQSTDYSNARSQDVYTMTVHFDAANKYESELNNSYTTSNLIALNTPYLGSITSGYHNEQDYYRVETTNPGYLSVNFEHERMGNSDGYWNVALYNEAYNKLCERKIYGNSTGYTLPSIGVPTGTYYIIITSTDYSNAKSDTTYKLTASYQVSDVWEKELNESYSSATPIEIGKTYYGTSMSGYHSEKDFYRFSAPSSDIYTIALTTKLMTSESNYYNVALYDAAYKELTNFNLPGNVTSHKTIETLSAGTYYLRVQSSDYSNAKSEETYSISVTGKKSSSSGSGTSADKAKPTTKATITASTTKVRRGKKTTVKIVCNSGANLAVVGKNALAKNKKYVKIKNGRTAKLIFYKRASKGKYIFKVTSSANGSYKKTTKTITIRVK